METVTREEFVVFSSNAGKLWRISQRQVGRRGASKKDAQSRMYERALSPISEEGEGVKEREKMKNIEEKERRRRGGGEKGRK